MSARMLAVFLLVPTLSIAQEPPAEPAAAEDAELTPEQQREMMKQAFGFESGPLDAKLDDVATVKVPEGWLFAGKEGTKGFLEATNNLPSGKELGTMLNPADDSWILFTFNPIGYVNDDDKDALDADAMLESIKEGTEAANAIFKERGLPTMSIVGWAKAPHYDEKTHNLEWAPKGRNSDGEEVVNYNTRLLGRRGVMEVALIVDPDKLEGAMPALRTTMTNFAFTKGEDYASFVQGDKVAEYGLAALVTGGAVAVAAKSGLLQKFWKLILVAVAGVIAAVKKLFGGKSSEEQQS